MNSKNIFIAIGVIGIGVILYKLLLGFVLPIALFVSLGYVLKFLLKGSESESDKEFSQVLTNHETPASSDKIVEIKPIEAEKTAEATQRAELAKTDEIIKLHNEEVKA